MLYIKLNNIMKHFEVLIGSHVNYNGKQLYAETWDMNFDEFLEKHKDHKIWVNGFGHGFVRAIVYKDVNNFMLLLGA